MQAALTSEPRVSGLKLLFAAIIGALVVLLAASGPSGVSARTVAATLLIAAALVFTVGGFLYAGRAIWQWPAAKTVRYLRWERGSVVAAIIVNLLGFVLLETLLNEAGDAIFARPAMAAYLLASGVAVVAESHFLSTREWHYTQIVVYVVLAFLAQAAIGYSLVQTGLVAAWVGWATIVWNLAWLAALPIVSPREIYYPVLHHVAPLLIGIALLAR